MCVGGKLLLVLRVHKDALLLLVVDSEGFDVAAVGERVAIVFILQPANIHAFCSSGSSLPLNECCIVNSGYLVSFGNETLFQT